MQTMALAQNIDHLCMGLRNIFLAACFCQERDALAQHGIHTQGRRIRDHHGLILVVAHEISFGLQQTNDLKSGVIEHDVLADN